MEKGDRTTVYPIRQEEIPSLCAAQATFPDGRWCSRGRNHWWRGRRDRFVSRATFFEGVTS